MMLRISAPSANGPAAPTPNTTIRIPARSACTTATVVSGSRTVTGDTTGGVDEFRTTCGNHGVGNDRPYVIDVPYAFDLRAEVTAATFDTVLHLRRACDDPATELACDDDGGTGSLSLIDVAGLEPGEREDSV